MVGSGSDREIVIWLVEDNVSFRKSIASLLNQNSRMRCARSFESCETALAGLKTVANPPDVVLMDINLPGISGLEGLRLMKLIVPSVQVVMLTVFDENEKIFQAICSGASGYLLKSMSPQKIVESLEEILQGGAPMNARIARKVLDMFSRFMAPKGNYGFTPREQEILQLLVEGYPKKQIADRLDLSFHTIDMHMRNIYTKMQVHSRSGAVAKALKENLL
jgi:DNA-binding NarL/FixJ family response regulator